ncbi:MAG: AAA family ATPase [Eubacterium sp.]|nr:AAA family ATPase [Eubacterium sp.]
MNRLSDIEGMMTEMKSGDELIKALEIKPDYDESIRQENMAVRLVGLSDIYNAYVPSKMTEEIYYKLYLALVYSMRKKTTRKAVLQQNENHKAVMAQEYRGIIGGADSLLIAGSSGIGKSAAISRAISLISDNGVIELDMPYSFIIACIVVQCPFDSSVKNLLLEILRKADEQMGSSYYQNAVRARATTDMLLGMVSQVSLNHIGLLVIDEIQNVVNSKNGRGLIGMLTQLINDSGISICMVGTPESVMFFESSDYLARRSLGLQYRAMDYGDDFHKICKELFSYQYVRHGTELTEAVIEWLYEHSAGIISNIVVLMHDAQEIAIMDGTETLDIGSLNKAYKNRMALLHGYIVPSIQKGKSTATIKKNADKIHERKENQDFTEEMVQENLIALLVSQAKQNGTDIVKLLQENLIVMEVSV